ncbi:hypothetical protein [uncultured Roseobacter sp.]|uniref:hypothetical protein n=1 Tax=uncultured Roseobacter sp. TaxID=114847 RepID=UPI002624A33E|nr:hypothetical protein [uncultured Roseobacter sp.]
MGTEQIFQMQFILSMIVTAMVGVWWVRPWLARTDFHDGLFLLTVPHALRHLGMVFLVPAVVHADMPQDFALEAGYGDLAAGIIALIALPALHYRLAVALPLVWLFNIVGTVDLLNALPQTNAIPFFRSAWYIPTFIVPVLLVTHALMFVALIERLRGVGAGRKPAL